MALPRVVDDAAVRWITIDRPEAANALTMDDLQHLTAAVRDVDPATRAVVFTGAGERAFCAGMHLDTFRGLTPSSARDVITQVGEFLATVRHCPAITVVMLNGACLGVASELALACDLRVARAGVMVGLPEVKLGIPSVVDAALLPAYVGLSRAREMILTGDSVAVEDLGSAFANRIVAPSELRAETERLLASVLAHTPTVIAAQKSLFETWLNNGISDSVTVSIEVFGDVFTDPSTADAVESYASKTVGTQRKLSSLFVDRDTQDS
jgi:enoyl-CoA hydratase/carnithine racemase